MGEILDYNNFVTKTKNRKDTEEPAGLPFDELSIISSAMDYVSNMLRRLHHDAEEYVKNELELPVESFNEVEFSNMSIKDVMDEK